MLYNIAADSKQDPCQNIYELSIFTIDLNYALFKAESSA